MKIIIVCNLPLKKLPPAISIINCLSEMNYEIILITPYLEDHYKNMFKMIKVYEFYDSEDWEEKLLKRNFISRFKLLFHDYNEFIFKSIENEYCKGDFIWLLHESTALRLDNRILNYTYILSVYELSKEIKVLRYFSSEVKKVAQNAKLVITPEYNRSNILAVWWDLKNLPLVLPNKPFLKQGDLYESDELNDTKSLLMRKANGRKIVLYQGVFGPDRKLDVMIEAIKERKELYMVLMGPKNEYLESLISQYKEYIFYIPVIPAPNHLQITQMASIGIVNYVTNSISPYDPLNVVYCAPNKIYEYARFGIPMICSDQPGLFYTVSMMNAGLCVNTEKVKNIRNAISEIYCHYEKYSIGSKALYKSVSVKEIINEIILKIKEDLK